jgi:hypothetical protein
VVARWHSHLHGFATVIYETAGLGLALFSLGITLALKVSLKMTVGLGLFFQTLILPLIISLVPEILLMSCPGRRCYLADANALTLRMVVLRID